MEAALRSHGVVAAAAVVVDCDDGDVTVVVAAVAGAGADGAAAVAPPLASLKVGANAAYCSTLRNVMVHR